jgi:hypothetical protein
VPSLKCLRRIPAPIAPVIQTNVDFQIEIVPADGIRLPFPASGEFGTSPFFGQHLVKLISSTVRQRSISGCVTHSEFASTHPLHRRLSEGFPDLRLQRERPEVARLGRQGRRPRRPLPWGWTCRPQLRPALQPVTQTCHFMGKQSDGTSRDLSQLHPCHATRRLTLPLREYAG